MANPIYLVRCWYCRQWHGEYEPCPVTFIKLVASLCSHVVVGAFDLTLLAFELYIRLVTVGLIAMFAYLCFTII